MILIKKYTNKTVNFPFKTFSSHKTIKGMLVEIIMISVNLTFIKISN